MKLNDLFNEAAGVGLVVPGVNMPAGMHPDEIRRQAKKFGNRVSKNGVPPQANPDGTIGEETEDLGEKWTNKYKKSINCSHPKGFSQKAHCAARRKRRAGGTTSSRPVHESTEMLLADVIDTLIDAGHTNESAVSIICENLDENLRKWFKQKWVRFGPDGKIKGPCARGSDREGKPKCLPQSKAHALGQKARASAARRKRREDPNPERRGKAKNVATRESIAEVAKVRISLDPSDRGAYVYDEDPPEPTTMIPLGQITNVLEPDELHATKPGANARIAKMVKALEKGKQLPPVLVRKYQGGYQILDGHHRFKAYRMVNAKEIPARIVAPDNITGDVNEQSPDTSKLLDKPTMTVAELAAKYGVSKDTVMVELRKGIKVELEHTSKQDVAREIALDHLGEDLHYYEKLASVEADESISEKKDACYHKVRSRYKVWPSAYASGALVQCRKKGAKNWGNKSR
jgi:ParB-like nuclease domain/Protein of unknown function (DUF5661)